MAGKPAKTETSESMPAAHPSRQMAAMSAQAQATGRGKAGTGTAGDARLLDVEWAREGMSHHHSRNARAGAPDSGLAGTPRMGQTG